MIFISRLQLVQSVHDMEVQEMVLRAFESASSMSESVVNLDLMQYYLEEELFESVRDDVESFFEDFGIDMDIGGFSDIKREHLEISGIRIPELTRNTVESIFFEERICFIKGDSFIENSPQISCLEVTDETRRKGVRYSRSGTSSF